MSICPDALRTAARVSLSLEENREAMRRILGDRYPERIQPYLDLLRRHVPEQRLSVALEAARAMSAEGVAPNLLFAAAVESLQERHLAVRVCSWHEQVRRDRLRAAGYDVTDGICYACELEFEHGSHPAGRPASDPVPGPPVGPSRQIPTSTQQDSEPALPWGSRCSSGSDAGILSSAGSPMGAQAAGRPRPSRQAGPLRSEPQRVAEDGAQKQDDLAGRPPSEVEKGIAS